MAASTVTGSSKHSRTKQNSAKCNEKDPVRLPRNVPGPVRYVTLEAEHSADMSFVSSKLEAPISGKSVTQVTCLGAKFRSGKLDQLPRP